jgi:hypothetical protein
MDTPRGSLDRRAVLRRVGGALALGVVAPVAAAVEGCGKKPLSCADTAGLSFADAQTRVTLAYTDRALDPTKPCNACAKFRSAGADACGGCEVVKGPINPLGGCRSWTART